MSEQGETSLDQQIRAAQIEVSSPTAAARMRDALLIAVAKGMSDDGMVWPDHGLWAREASARVEALMALRAESVKRTLAEIETWGYMRAKVQGILLMTSSDLLAAALIARFGGSVEIPQAELASASRMFEGFAAETDEDREVVRFSTRERPASERDE